MTTFLPSLPAFRHWLAYQTLDRKPQLKIVGKTIEQEAKNSRSSAIISKPIGHLKLFGKVKGKLMREFSEVRAYMVSLIGKARPSDQRFWVQWSEPNRDCHS